MKIIVEFVGGPSDGRVLEGQVGDGSDAERYFLLTNHGAIGQKFKMLSDYAVETLAQEQLQVETPHNFQRHYYVVSERLEESGEVLIRALYVEREEEGRGRTAGTSRVPPTQPREPLPVRVEQYLAQTAKHLGQAYSHYWPQESSELPALPASDFTLYLGHQLLSDRFATLTPARHSDPETPALSILGIAPSQDWFLVGEILSVSAEALSGDSEGSAGDELVQRGKKAVQQLRSFWLHPDLAAAPCQAHVRRVAEHCRSGYAVVAGVGRVTGDLPDVHRGTWVNACFQGAENLEPHYPAPWLVRSYPDWGSYYLFAAYFEIPR